MEKSCIACGMPMNKPEEHASGDTAKAYCFHCAREDGSMRDYDEVLVGLTQFMVRSQGIDETAARDAAAGMMTQLPAWKDR